MRRHGSGGGADEWRRGVAGEWAEWVLLRSRTPWVEAVEPKRGGRGGDKAQAVAGATAWRRTAVEWYRGREVGWVVGAAQEQPRRSGSGDRGGGERSGGGGAPRRWGRQGEVGDGFLESRGSR